MKTLNSLRRYGQSGLLARRAFLIGGLGLGWAGRLFAATQRSPFEGAAEVLYGATQTGTIESATLYVRHKESEFTRTFGKSKSIDDIFLLASISKPMSVTALMTLYDQGRFQLDDPVTRFLPEFTGGNREQVTVRQLLTHVSGLPDQLPENESLRRRHAPLSEFVDAALRTPLKFSPGTQYSYSSMGILLASEIAHRVSGVEFKAFIADVLFRPLGMTRSALGLSPFAPDETVRCQVENAAPESGAGDASAKNWDWNSPYWREFGAPWGGAHGSAPNVARFLAEFLHPTGRVIKPETARLMVRNHNRDDLTPRGLGFAVGTRSGSPHCSPQTFGHSGATGTLAWADPKTETICVVLTTLPGRAANPHPRQLVSDRVAEAVT